MRYLIIVFLILAVGGCQSAARLPDPTSAAPSAVASITVEATATPMPTSTLVATRTSDLAAKQKPASQLPVPPTPITVAESYPSPEVVVDGEPVWSFRIINEYPHDSSAYTQGLILDGPTTLLEGTGRDSSLRQVDLETGEVEMLYLLPDDMYGEGITLFGDRIVQLTWKNQQGFIYDRDSFELTGVFTYPHEGWGITHDDSQLIVSDGTDIIRFWDPETFEEVRRIRVQGQYGPVTMLNELEYVDGEIWANIWFSDTIVRISPDDGHVLGWVDLNGLIDPQLRYGREAVLNGIAFDAQSNRIVVTGKLWPLLFEIEIVDPTRD